MVVPRNQINQCLFISENLPPRYQFQSPAKNLEKTSCSRLKVKLLLNMEYTGIPWYTPIKAV
jgi:hypothetical protein